VDIRKKLADIISRFPDKHLSTQLHGYFGSVISQLSTQPPEQQAAFLISVMPNGALKFAENAVILEPPIQPAEGYGLSTLKTALDQVLATPIEPAVMTAWTKEQRIHVYDWAVRELAWLGDKKYNRKAKPEVLRAYK
jgi:hypothetical protein